MANSDEYLINWLGLLLTRRVDNKECQALEIQFLSGLKHQAHSWDGVIWTLEKSTTHVVLGRREACDLIMASKPAFIRNTGEDHDTSRLRSKQPPSGIMVPVASIGPPVRVNFELYHGVNQLRFILPGTRGNVVLPAQNICSVWIKPTMNTLLSPPHFPTILSVQHAAGLYSNGGWASSQALVC